MQTVDLTKCTPDDLERFEALLGPLAGTSGDDAEGDTAGEGEAGAEHERQRVAQDAERIRERCQTLAGFVREARHFVEPNSSYVHGWHFDAIPGGPHRRQDQPPAALSPDWFV